ncbi:MAG: 50S ribosomal protein L18 [bacterium]
MISKVIRRKSNRERRKIRIRNRVFGTPEMPRLTVFRSNKYTYGQIIDDTIGVTLVASGQEVRQLHQGAKKSVAAQECGKLLAQKALKAKIAKVVFDRNGYLFTGRVADFAKGAREGGLKF